MMNRRIANLLWFVSGARHGRRERASSHQSARSTARLLPIILTAMGGQRTLSLR
jgi:hypothetical protein